MIKMTKKNRLIVLNIESSLSAKHVILSFSWVETNKGKENIKSQRFPFAAKDTGAIVKKGANLLKRFIKQGYSLTQGEQCTLFDFEFQRPNPLLALSWLSARVEA